MTLNFSNKDKMPGLGLGTWKSKPGEVKRAIKQAIELGYRHIDCAAIYKNEAEIGEALSECLAEGLVKREELWITSKLWNDGHRKEDVQPALEKTLSDLRLEYLDLYLMHWPVAFKNGLDFPEDLDGYVPLTEVPLEETWEAMQELQSNGLVRHIGTSNFSAKKLQRLIDVGGQQPEMNQVELHPYLQQQELIDFCHAHGIHVTAYSPLGSMDRHESMKKEGEPVPLKSDIIMAIAQKNGMSPARVLIRWQLQRNIAVIPKSTNPVRLKENLDSLNCELSETDMAEIKSMDQHKRIVDGAFFTVPEKGYTTESLWDE